MPYFISIILAKRHIARFAHWMASHAKTFSHVTMHRMRVTSYRMARGAGQLTKSQVFQGSLCSLALCIALWYHLFTPCVGSSKYSTSSHFLSVVMLSTTLNGTSYVVVVHCEKAPSVGSELTTVLGSSGRLLGIVHQRYDMSLLSKFC